ncbi:MAG: hypothetical protein ABIA04_15080 [Pseudomonadota bacterium]
MSLKTSKIIILIAFLMATFPCISTTLLYMDKYDLYENSKYLVKGTVISQEAQKLEGSNMVYTKVTVEVTESYKNEPTNSYIEILNPGGKINGEGVKVFGAPAFKDGENVLLFLRDSVKDVNIEAFRNINFSEVLAYSLGKFTVIEDAISGREIIVNSSTEVSLLKKDRFTGKLMKVDPSEIKNKFYLDEFLKDLTM